MIAQTLYSSSSCRYKFETGHWKSEQSVAHNDNPLQVRARHDPYNTAPRIQELVLTVKDFPKYFDEDTKLYQLWKEMSITIPVSIVE